MNLQEAIKCLREGKMVKLPHWDEIDGVLIMLKGKIYELSYFENKAHINEACLFSDDILSKKWQVVEGYSKDETCKNKHSHVSRACD